MKDRNMKKTNAMPALSDSKILSGAAISGVINGLINGVIQWYLLRGSTSIPLSVDAIANDELTVLGTVVPLAVTLAMILTVVTYWTLKAPKQRFFPGVLWLTIKHGVFAFGLIVGAAVAWQRLVGSVDVSLAAAVIILGVIAGLVGSLVNYMTIHATLLRTSGRLH